MAYWSLVCINKALSYCLLWNTYFVFLYMCIVLLLKNRNTPLPRIINFHVHWSVGTRTARVVVVGGVKRPPLFNWSTPQRFPRHPSCRSDFQTNGKYLSVYTRLHLKGPPFSDLLYFQAESALGLSEAHDQLVVDYLRSGRLQRSQCLKTVDSTFEELIESRLNEDTFTCEQEKKQQHTPGVQRGV